MNLFKIYLVMIAVMSFLSFVAFAVDKKRSSRESGRIPEIVLLSLATFGGATGAVAGMYLLRHKTNFATKFHFAITVWLSLIVQAMLAVLLAFEIVKSHREVREIL